jgi:hypothetical protein
MLFWEEQIVLHSVTATAALWLWHDLILKGRYAKSISVSTVL